MKKIKFIPALALVAMLAACGGSKSVSVKAPKFAKEGKEVEFTDFAEALDKEDLLGIWNEVDAPEKVPSYIIESKASSEGTKKYFGSDNKSKSEYVEKSVENDTVKADMKNVRLQIESKSNSSESRKDNTGSFNEFKENKTEFVYQYGKVSGKDAFMYIDTVDEIFLADDSFDGASDAEKLAYMAEGAIMYVGNVVGNNFYDTVDNYEGLPEEAKANYKFYLNGNVLTITYTYENTYEQKDADDKVKYTVSSVANIKMQLDASKGENFAYKEAYESVETINFAQDAEYDGDEYFAGEMIELGGKEYYEAKVNVKDVTVKEVDVSNFFDLSDYA